MSDRLPQLMDPDAPVFPIGVAAQLAGLHPQTLRTYDRMGLVSPQRARGRGRRYSPRDVAGLRLVQRLSQDEGINLPGIRRILELQAALEAAEREVDQLNELVRTLAADPTMPRVFSADARGAVNLRRRATGVRELTS